MAESSKSILDILKVKKEPTTRTAVMVKYSQPEKPVVLKGKVEDKRAVTKINRDEILSKLGQKPPIQSEIPLSVVKAEEEKFGVQELVKEKETIKKELKEEPTSEDEEAMLLAAIEDEPVVQSEPISAEKDLDEEMLLAALDDESTSKPSKSKTKKITTTLPSGKTKKITITKPKHTELKIPLEEDVAEGISQLKKKLPSQKPNVLVKASAYYLNNREIFINFINSLLQPYLESTSQKEKEYSCDDKGSLEFSLLSHQKLVRDYINIFTPYRGLLLFHGLGSGKTCSSIAIAEGIKSDKEVIIMLPASLEVNYKEELKKCGDILYKKNQYWEFIDVTSSPDLINPLAFILNLSPEFIRKNKGAWFINVEKEPNYSTLTVTEQTSLNEQINKMIDNKYKFIRYNGLRQKRLDQMVADSMSKTGQPNPFSNKVIVIDEAHNLISRIVNKLDKGNSLSMQLYQYLKSAENSRIVMLTGTPIINYPNEIGIMMNILRGNIRTWTFQLQNEGSFKLTQDSILELFKSNLAVNNLLDYLQYKSTPEPTLTITRNPFGFYTSNSKTGEFMGVALGESGNISDEDFIKLITEILLSKNIKIVTGSISVKEHNCLPDTLSAFSSLFIEPPGSKNPSPVKNMDLLKRRVLGLVSYFPDIDALLPRYSKDKNYRIIMIPMSDFQFGVYEEARVEERKIERNNAKKRAKQGKGGSEVYEESVSTYRIFSRAFCNFVFPREGGLRRPLPNDGSKISSEILATATEDLLDATIAEELVDESTGEPLTATIKEDSTVITSDYKKNIADALRLLNERRDDYLTPKALEIYSPKFLNILSRIIDEENIGLHMIYSQFKTLEGIGILSLVLKANGFAQFKITKVGTDWKLNIAPEDIDKPKYILYTGTEQPEEKEILRNIFNSNWDSLPIGLRQEILDLNIGTNNYMGELIKVIMITASGAEGISLSNVRYVHITEPYWHPVRINQVIGRARRICSHKNLPKEFQTVEVFIYLMEFTDAQLQDEKAVELKLHDKSKVNPKMYLTSDQALFEIAQEKEKINVDILKNIKEASIDCNIHNKLGSKDQLKCFTFGSVDANKFSYTPTIGAEEKDEIASINKVKVKLKLKNVTLDDKKFAVDMANVKKENEYEKGIIEAGIYTLESVAADNPIQIGILYFKDLKPKNYVFFGSNI